MSVLKVGRGRLWVNVAGGAAALLLTGACDTSDGGSGGGAEPVACETSGSGRDAKTSCVSGRVVEHDGSPLVGMSVTACTEVVCIFGTSDADGQYSHSGLATVSHTMHVLAQAPPGQKGHMMLTFDQPTEDGWETAPGRDIVVPQWTGEDAAWDKALGGTVSLAEGALEVTAPADSLVFPIGESGYARAVAIAAHDIAPFDNEPWIGKEAQTLAFIINPYPIKSTEGFELTVRGVADVAAGAVYRVYAADELRGGMHEVGTAVSDGAGAVVLEAGSTLHELTTLVMVPN